MTRPGIEAWCPGPLANTLLIRPKGRIGTSKMIYSSLDHNEERSNMKQFLNEIPTLGIRIQSYLLFLLWFISEYRQSASDQENTLHSGVEYPLLSVACLDNSVGWSLEEFKFRVELLPQSFSKMLPVTDSIRLSCGVQPFFFLRREYLLFTSLQILFHFFVTEESN